jgi:hypothetical protein
LGNVAASATVAARLQELRNSMIMSKTDNAPECRELQDSELEFVSGGLVVLAIIQPLIALVLPIVQSDRKP